MLWAYGALPWLGALLALALLLLAFAWWPLRLDISGRARGEADGRWVVAAGCSLSGLSIALVWARGIKPQISVQLFGKKLSWKPSWRQQLARPVPKRVKEASGRAWARVDPLGLALKVVEERRHVRLRYLVLDLVYGFRDPLLTGRLVGALSVLSAVLPHPIEIRQAPRWDFEDGWEISLDGRAIVRPWLALLDIAGYVVRQAIRHEREQDRRGRGEPAAGSAGHFKERDDHRRAPAGR
ncbi:MAG TPA: hypothetical protein VHB79_12115 [Polyangiaceae bacterium]|nr:hypothetical protein [Polyangiaceae bacterium]